MKYTQSSKSFKEYGYRPTLPLFSRPRDTLLGYFKVSRLPKLKNDICEVVECHITSLLCDCAITMLRHIAILIYLYAAQLH